MESMNKDNPSFLDWRSLARTHPSAFLLAAQLLSFFYTPHLTETQAGASFWVRSEF